MYLKGETIHQNISTLSQY